MSVKVLCPNCSRESTFHRRPVTLCAHCQQPYPEAIRTSAELSLAAANAGKPLLLKVGQLMSVVLGVTLLAVLLGALIDVGEFSLDGQPVSGPAFLRVAGPAFVIIGLLFIAIAWALWRNKSWARPLMMFYWLALSVVVVALSWGTPQGLTQGLGTVANLIPLAIVAWWYLYRKQNVVSYFAVQETLASITDRAA